MTIFSIDEKTGMKFKNGMVPEFGSIRASKTAYGEYYLLAADIPKLNSVLTRSSCSSSLAGDFNVPGGAVAFVADWKTAGSAKAYMYEESSDAWYEFVEGE